MKEDRKSIPFTVDRRNPATLVRQVADGCRNAIATGFFKVGTMLPSLQGLADELGVSVKVTRSAYRQLAREGWLLPRNGVGFFAKDAHAPIWRGSALVVYDNNSYSMRTHADALAYGFEDGGYIVDCVKLPKKRTHGTHDITRLKMHMFREYDFVFTYVMDSEVVECLRTLDCPLFSSSKNAARHPFLKNILVDETAAYGELVSVCRAAGVKSIEVVGIMEYHRDVDKMLRASGFRVTSTITSFDHREDMMFSSIRRSARTLFMRRLASAQRNLPDLFLFMDDFALSGALSAFSSRGVKVPEDVRIAVLSSKGNEPCWDKELTSLVYDQDESGRQMAAEILKSLSGGRMKTSVDGVLKLVRGDTL